MIIKYNVLIMIYICTEGGLSWIKFFKKGNKLHENRWSMKFTPNVSLTISLILHNNLTTSISPPTRPQAILSPPTIPLQ